MVLTAHDVDGSPSSGYPYRVSLSKNQDTLDPTGELRDPVTGYSGPMLTVITDDSGRAAIELDALPASQFSASADFATAFAAGQVADIGYELPKNVEVAMTDSTNRVIIPATIPGQETLTVNRIIEGFAVFPLPNGEYPYPDTIKCYDSLGVSYRMFSLHPSFSPGINFTADMMPSQAFLYSIDENAIYVPDVSVFSINVMYSVRPFYVDEANPTVLKIYNRKNQVNIAPNKSLAQRLSAAILNAGLIVPGRDFCAVETSSEVVMGAVFRDTSGGGITGNINFFPDVILYLWAEYPNPNGPNPLRRVRELHMTNPLHQVKQAIYFVRG